MQYIICCQVLGLRAMLSPAMAKKPDEQKGGARIFRDIPRELMKRAKVAAANEETTIKALMMEALEKKILEVEKKHTQKK